MKQSFRTLGLGGLVTAFALTAGLALAAPGNGFGQPPRDRAQRLAQELELTEEQEEVFDRVHEGLEALREGNRERMQELAEAMEAELEVDAPDARKVHRLIDERLEVQGVMVHARMDGMLEIRSVLTPEQRAEFDELMERRRSHRHKARGRQGPQGGPPGQR